MSIGIDEGGRASRAHEPRWCGQLPSSSPVTAPEVVEELRFEVMGTRAHVIVVGSCAGGAARVRERLEELDRRWSRFRADSELSRLNARAGEPCAVSEDTRLLVERGREGWWMTGGSFDPTVLGAVIRSGYERDFEFLRDGARGGTSLLEVGCEGIEVDDRVLLPAGTGFDSGGIGKGLAADLAVEELRADGAQGVCVNVGGDLRVEGEGPEGPWTVGIEHPWLDHPLALLGMWSGAIATSTTLRRRWSVGGSVRHHLVDPSTGAPSTTDVNLAVVVGAEAWRCEVLAKAVLLKGMDHPFDILGGTGLEGLMVADDGSVRSTEGLRPFLGGADLPERIGTPIARRGDPVR